MPTLPSPPPGSLARRVPPPEFPSPRLRLGLAFVLLAAIVALLLPLGMRAASAAELGAGYSNSNGTFIGAMRYDGQNAYCIELTKPRPVGKPTRPLGRDEPMPAAVSSLSATERAQLHWAVSNAGASSDPTLTTAVAMLVWSIADAGHYPGDQHYFTKMPQATASAVAEQLEQLRGELAMVQVIERPKSVAVTVVRLNDGVHVQVPKVGTGVHVTLSLEAATIDGSSVVALDGGRSHDLLVKHDTRKPEVIADVSTAPAAGYATSDLRVLVTEGRQLLIQSSQAAWPQASDRLGIGAIANKTRVPETTPPASTPVGNTPSPTPVGSTPKPSLVGKPSTPAPTPTPTSTPTPTPTPTQSVPNTPTPTTTPTPTATPTPKPKPKPTKTPVPTTTPTPAPTPTPKPTTTPTPTPETPKPSPTPTPESTTPAAPPAPPERVETPEAPPTESPTPTLTPTPAPTPPPTPTATATPSESPAPPAAASPTESHDDETPAPPAPEANDETPRLAETGAKPGIWFGVAGAGLALIGLGGWLIARDRQRREATSW
ncbi:LPXTG cell wall anchor domain-containing protein [Gulosibacter sp. ACHW.36C]|uniref:LPXTG cell wall anchor domain-containing protein n=1 Tax=Gulosibacter sediminis TaxID=1729695 RepID=A0ABY4N186_9MICO|nr:LPXTG cell wall anchor domain-containing protein [Gulosibacter sediminis]UQN15401.1 LPXTG cell wall anchor domain-containing protein [Gulosibacter sediminis]